MMSLDDVLRLLRYSVVVVPSKSGTVGNVATND